MNGMDVSGGECVSVDDAPVHHQAEQTLCFAILLSSITSAKEVTIKRQVGRCLPQGQDMQSHPLKIYFETEQGHLSKQIGLHPHWWSVVPEAGRNWPWDVGRTGWEAWRCGQWHADNMEERKMSYWCVLSRLPKFRHQPISHVHQQLNVLTFSTALGNLITISLLFCHQVVDMFWSLLFLESVPVLE